MYPLITMHGGVEIEWRRETGGGYMEMEKKFLK